MNAVRGLALALCVAAGRASACGHCIEDRVAVVYDYAVEQRARRDGLEIAYLGIEGGPLGGVDRTLRETPGVIADTVRIAESPAAAAFAWQPADARLDALLAAVHERLGPSHVKLTVLRTWDATSGLH